ncbi:hypothetical protein BTO05_10325 [Winogradskyella sp. PC-19]|nr:hypothetical protein BTO05_10325 [Winogradskyella sp. PC-19]RZN83585.1 MAG: hypothetical protein EVB12_01335 [Winogradskyella sp.]
MNWLNKKRLKKVAVILIAAFFISQLLLLIFEKDFAQAEWQSKPQERYQMVDDIIESQLFIGKSQADVITLLGQPALTLNNQKLQLIYRLGKAPSFFDNDEAELVITFQDKKVIKVTENKN